MNCLRRLAVGRKPNNMQPLFPYFGGKSAIASAVWRYLGDPDVYVEPFFGSGAILFSARNWEHRHEIVCDKDPHICNVWRSIKFKPEAVAEWADWPVTHADLIARKQHLVNRTEALRHCLEDPEWCDPVGAGYWIWAAGCWIGSGMTRPNQVPHLFSPAGVHKKSLQGQIPHLTAGRGVHKKSLQCQVRAPNRWLGSCGSPKAAKPSFGRGTPRKAHPYLRGWKGSGSKTHLRTGSYFLDTSQRATTKTVRPSTCSKNGGWFSPKKKKRRKQMVDPDFRSHGEHRLFRDFFDYLFWSDTPDVGVLSQEAKDYFYDRYLYSNGITLREYIMDNAAARERAVAEADWEKCMEQARQ